MRAAALLAALLAFLAIGVASAHTRSESHSTWLVDGASVHLTFSMPDLEAARITNDGRAPDDAQAIAYLRSLESVTAGGAACALAVPPHAVAAAPGYRRFEFLFETV